MTTALFKLFFTESIIILSNLSVKIRKIWAGMSLLQHKTLPLFLLGEGESGIDQGAGQLSRRRDRCFIYRQRIGYGDSGAPAPCIQIALISCSAAVIFLEISNMAAKFRISALCIQAYTVAATIWSRTTFLIQHWSWHDYRCNP